MAFKLAILLLLAVTLVSADFCPSYTCTASLPANMCGYRINNNSFNINSNGCTSNYVCSANAYLAWVTLAMTSAFSCTQQPVATNSTVAWTPVPCKAMLVNKNFKNNAALIACRGDSDCELDDGSYTYCACTFRSDGLGICTPDPSNDIVFSGYWDDCAANDNELKLSSQYNYWTWYMRYWTLSQSNLLCIGVFQEIITLNQLQAIYNEGEKLALAVAALVVVLN